jgi:hypothetical protein
MMIATHIHSRTSVNDNETAAGAKSNWLQVLIASSSNPDQTGYLAPSFPVIFNDLLAFSCRYFPNSNSFIITTTRQELAVMIK